ncbi:MAG: rhodanese-like domain-containing protein [Deltaproteobacteria bacterium]|nr:rhodanese-like domain-containing protein [Deltaproteobacteria bacterium]
METISTEELQERLSVEAPDNDDPREGYALVNVLSNEAFLEEHIPESINIAKGEEWKFTERFDRSKEIIVYCASHDCPASTQVAQELVELGFSRVADYEGGIAEWKAAGNTVGRGESTLHELRMA